ncbi:uncharacterized protein [Temnothorax longispinosus]|uniref:uncharacterized protein n=1 Tax=Temnothorax longispinosus TaxID=300112 RepID=UPI003A9A205C
MSDHLNYYTVDSSEIHVNDCDPNDGSEPESIITIEEKSGDELLIELYRERPFLYDKSNNNFKDSAMKQNAWSEISKIMIQTNCGDIYTPSYCQKRCISLKEQYNREKKKMEIESRSGSGAAKSSRFPFFKQLEFLDNVIKRRKSYTNCTKSQSHTLEKNNICDESQSVANEECVNTEENENDKEHIYNTKNFYKENEEPKQKKRKINETMELEQTLFQMSQKIYNYMEKKDEIPTTKADDAFMEFIKIQFSNISEKEKDTRRKMVMDALTAPLSEK